MYHPLYFHARRLVGRPVYARHMNGRVYHGWLNSVTPQGVYVSPVGAGQVAAKTDSADVDFAAQANTDQLEVDCVYGPGWYLAFGALAGLTAASVAPYFW